MNEEYKSATEELETSKEELQSVNEELQTVNTELENKLDALSRAHGDLQNLVDATEVGILFLDRALQIRRFSPPMTDILNIRDSDQGRPIGDLTHKLRYDALEADARQVLDDLVPIDKEVQSTEGAWYLMRIRPYRTVEDKIDGVVVSFVDITERRRRCLRRSSIARLRRHSGGTDIRAQAPRTGTSCACRLQRGAPNSRARQSARFRPSVCASRCLISAFRARIRSASVWNRASPRSDASRGSLTVVSS